MRPETCGIFTDMPGPGPTAPWIEFIGSPPRDLPITIASAFVATRKDGSREAASSARSKVDTARGIRARRQGATDRVKLEDQVPITEDGAENVTRYPFVEKLVS